MFLKLLYNILLFTLVASCTGDGGINSSGMANGAPSSDDERSGNYYIFRNVYFQLYYENSNEKLIVFNDKSYKQDITVNTVNYTTGETDWVAYSYSINSQEAKVIDRNESQLICAKSDLCLETHISMEVLANILIDPKVDIPTEQFVINSGLNVGHFSYVLKTQTDNIFINSTEEKEIILTIDQPLIQAIYIYKIDSSFSDNLLEFSVIEADRFDIEETSAHIKLTPKSDNSFGDSFKLNLKKTSSKSIDVISFGIKRPSGDTYRHRLSFIEKNI
jgi:hypothetical protein